MTACQREGVTTGAPLATIKLPVSAGQWLSPGAPFWRSAQRLGQARPGVRWGASAQIQRSSQCRFWKSGHDKCSQIRQEEEGTVGVPPWGGERGWPAGPLLPGPHPERKRLLFCFMSTSLPLDSLRDFKQINAPLGSRNALTDNFRP